MIEAPFKVPRSTYSRKNAMQMKYVFDQILKEKQSVFVPLSTSPYTLMTLRMKLSDGLNWLKDYHEPYGDDKYTKDHYQHIKDFCKIKIKEDGILVEYRNKVLLTEDGAAKVTTKDKKEKINSAQPNNQSAPWRSSLLKFIESEDKLFHVKDLKLSSIDQDYVKHLLGNTNFEFSVNENEIKIVK